MPKPWAAERTTEKEPYSMGHKGTERALFEHNLANAKAAAKAATPNKSDKVMSTKLNPGGDRGDEKVR